MEKCKPGDNLKRHLANLKIFTGFWHSTFFLKGEAKPKTVKRKTIFKWKKP